MKRLTVMLIATLISITSQASIGQSGKEYSGQPIATQSAAPVATQNVQARASVLKIPKVKLLRSKPQKVIAFNEWYYDDAEDDALITSYRREDLTKLEPLDDLPDHIRWRLFLARQLALLKHRQLYS